MKRSSNVRLVLMGAAASGAAALLTGCSDGPSQPASYTSVQQCVDAGNEQQVCQAAYANAQKEMGSEKTFGAQGDCETAYGASHCHMYRDSSGNDVWGPLLAGFVLGQMLSGPNCTWWNDYCSRGSSYVYVGHPIYYGSGGGYVYHGGWSGGSSGRGVASTPAPAPSRVVTSSRGVFGSTAAARGSWSGGFSSGG